MAPHSSLPRLDISDRPLLPAPDRPSRRWRGRPLRPRSTATVALVVALAACTSSPTPGPTDGQALVDPPGDSARTVARPEGQEEKALAASSADAPGSGPASGPPAVPAVTPAVTPALAPVPANVSGDRLREAEAPSIAANTSASQATPPGETPARVGGGAARSLPGTPPHTPPHTLSHTLPHVLPVPMPRPMPTLPRLPDNERYQALQDNPVQRVAEAPVSTFSIDVDTGSWSNIRRFLAGGNLPRRDAVRVEEMVNYFPYDYARPTDGQPFAVHTALAVAPWNADRVLMRVAVKGEDKSLDRLPPANLVFLVDVSGSMAARDKLPLLQSSLKLLTAKLRPQDRLSLVTYASGTASPLVAVAGNEKARINQAIDGLRASGSTAGASGIELAYQVASQAFIRDGINRILLATDGDFNVGVTDFNQLKQMVETRRASGISLSSLGFGTGNLNEHLMEQLADAGDGAYSYIDTLMEGQKVLVTEMSSTLATIARDVKIQVEFNPAVVAEYRLIGYENRMLAREDFNNDKVDAGDVGAGHAVTALYELTPAGKVAAIDPLRYRPGRGDANGGDASGGGSGGTSAGASGAPASAGETAFVRIRYKAAGADTSQLIERPVPARVAATLDEVDGDFRFAAAIAGFGQMLRGGRHTGQWSLADARALAARGVGEDRFGYRGEALRLMDLAGSLATNGSLQPVASADPLPADPPAAERTR